MTTDELIYTTARGGSPMNPGLPAALAYLLVAQAKHETGNFTSNFYRKYNNLFGYSYVPGAAYQSGPGTVADNGQPIAAYSSPEKSVYELIDWLYRRRSEGKMPDFNTIIDADQYARLLKSAGYYGDTVENYAAGLKRFFLDNPAAASAGGFGMVALVVWLVWRFGK